MFLGPVDLVNLKNHPFFSSLLNHNAQILLDAFYKDICDQKQMFGNPVIKLLDAMIEKHTFHM